MQCSTRLIFIVWICMVKPQSKHHQPQDHLAQSILYNIICFKSDSLLQGPSLHQLSLLSLPAQVYAVRWHMGHYGSSSAKPERGWTNNKQFQHLNKGKWTHKQNPGTVKTVKRTINKETGKVSTTGTKALKSTQFSPYSVCACHKT